MKLNLNLKNDDNFKKSLENTFSKPASVESGMYQCEINLALLKSKKNGAEQCIAVTFDAFDNTGKKKHEDEVDWEVQEYEPYVYAAPEDTDEGSSDEKDTND